MVRLPDPNLAAQQSIVLAGAEREHPIPEHLHLLQEVFQEVHSDAVSEQTYYRWRQKYGGMAPEMAKQVKSLEKENTRLKKLVAEQALDMEILKEAAKGNW